MCAAGRCDGITRPSIPDRRGGERPERERRDERNDEGKPQPQSRPPAPVQPSSSIGLSVRELDRDLGRRLAIPSGVRGVVVSRVEPMGGAFDAGIERGWLVLEINRQPVATTTEFHRIVASARPGDVLALYLYIPEIDQRALRTIRLDER